MLGIDSHQVKDCCVNVHGIDRNGFRVRPDLVAGADNSPALHAATLTCDDAHEIRYFFSFFRSGPVALSSFITVTMSASVSFGTAFRITFS